MNEWIQQRRTPTFRYFYFLTAFSPSFSSFHRYHPGNAPDRLENQDPAPAIVSEMSRAKSQGASTLLPSSHAIAGLTLSPLPSATARSPATPAFSVASRPNVLTFRRPRIARRLARPRLSSGSVARLRSCAANCRRRRAHRVPGNTIGHSMRARMVLRGYTLGLEMG